MPTNIIRESVKIIVDHGQFKDKVLICGYCHECRGKTIYCKGGEHTLEHFTWFYRKIICNLPPWAFRYWLYEKLKWMC